MAISDGTAGAWVATTTRNPTVTLPSHSAGQMLLVRVGWKSATPTTDVAVCNTSGWAKIGQFYNSGGASSNGGGGVLVAVFWKVATSSSETNPVIEFDDEQAPTPGCYSAVSYSKGASETWETPVGDGGAIAAATSYSGTIQSHISARSGDMLDAFAVTNDNTTLTVPTVSQSGLTLDTVTEYPATALSSSTSNDISADGRNRLATAGTSSAAAVVSGTNSVADPGSAWCTRLRVSQNITLDLLDGSRALYAPTVQRMLDIITLPLLEQVGGPVRGSAISGFSNPCDYTILWTKDGTWSNNSGASASGGVMSLYSSPIADAHNAAWYLNGGTSTADIDVQATINLSGQTVSSWGGGVLYRWVSGSGGWYIALAYRYSATQIGVRLYRTSYDNSTGLSGATSIVTNVLVGTLDYTAYLKIRAVVVGSTHYVKVWLASESEPDAWNIGPVTDSTYSDAGKVGVVSDVGGDEITAIDQIDAYAATIGAGAPVLYAPVVEGVATEAQTITLGLLDGSNALYAPALYPQPVTVTLAALENTPTLYAPTLTPKNTLTLGVIDGVRDLYAPTLAPKSAVTLGVIDAANALYAPTLTPKNAIDLAVIDGSNALYAPTLAVGPVTVTLDLLDAANALYAPAVLPQPVTIDLGVIDAANALYAPTLSTLNTIDLSLLDAGPTLYAPTVEGLGGTQDVTLALLDAGAALYAPTLVPTNTVALALLDAGAALYAPALTTLTTLTIPFLDSGSALYAPTLAQDEFLTIPLLDAGPALYAPTLAVGPVTVALGLLDGAPAVYAPAITGVNTLILGLLDGNATLYAPTVTGGAQLIVLSLLDGEAALYAPSVVPDQFLTLGLLDGSRDLYPPVISPAAITLGLALLDAGAQLYQPTLAPISTIALDFLDAASALYAPTITGAAVTVALDLIDGGRATYAPTLVATNSIVLGLLDGVPTLYAPSVANIQVAITGVTRDANGNPVAFATVDCFVAATNVFHDTTTSDANGVYTIVVNAAVEYFLVAYTASIFGVTARDLVGA
ncbi:MAG: hypothetical protein MUE48_00190 [Desulfobacterales bacterium]|nr:hypothetical protein [Desulfobacterales bacterium]